jgi:hypothetical protein
MLRFRLTMPYFEIETTFTCPHGHQNVWKRYHQAKDLEELGDKLLRRSHQPVVCSLCPPETPLRGDGKGQVVMYALTDDEFAALGVIAEPDMPVM